MFISHFVSYLFHSPLFVSSNWITHFAFRLRQCVFSSVCCVCLLNIFAVLVETSSVYEYRIRIKKFNEHSIRYHQPFATVCFCVHTHIMKIIIAYSPRACIRSLPHIIVLLCLFSSFVHSLFIFNFYLIKGSKKTTLCVYYFNLEWELRWNIKNVCSFLNLKVDYVKEIIQKLS